METGIEEFDYAVVVNGEEQYSIWPTFKEIPPGWRAEGKTGSKAECLAHIKVVWTDMRPLSLRKKLEEQSAQRKKQDYQNQGRPTTNKLGESPTVAFLVQGTHPITTRPTDRNSRELKESLDRNYLHLTFTDTRGGTSLGISIDPKKSKLNSADFEQEKGSVHIEGSLILDYVRLKCCADINLSDLEGIARLEIIERLTPFQALSN